MEDAFFRWACVVARFEVLKYRRKCARDRLVLSEETIQLLTTDAESRSIRSDIESQSLERCLNELKDADRRLLLSVHTRGQSVAEIARKLGQSARRLYSRVNVLRDVLCECMRNKIAEGGT
jgi:RNA polymerase sigma-70 factor (ECF subfamily)